MYHTSPKLLAKPIALLHLTQNYTMKYLLGRRKESPVLDPINIFKIRDGPTSFSVGQPRMTIRDHRKTFAARQVEWDKRSFRSSNKIRHHRLRWKRGFK